MPLTSTVSILSDIATDAPAVREHGRVEHRQPVAPGIMRPEIEELLILAHEQAKAHTYEALINTFLYAAHLAREIQLDTLADAAGVIRRNPKNL